ncbi:MAG: elongation factor P [Planctomycetes bacterium]|nr:elongation factor P [Planctomycetota bacterium]
MIANDLKKGSTFIFNSEVHEVLDYSHEKPGKGGAFVVAKIKNWRTGKIFSNRFRSSEKVEDAFIEKTNLVFSYRDSGEFVFSNPDTWEETRVSDEQIGDDSNYIVDGIEVLAVSYRGEILGVRLPEAVVLQVTEAPPAVKGDTSSGATKIATLETGYKVDVPLFIAEGERIKVSTSTGRYLERA